MRSKNYKRGLLRFLLLLIISTALFFIFVTVADYKPDLIENLEVLGDINKKILRWIQLRSAHGILAMIV